MKQTLIDAVVFLLAAGGVGLAVNSQRENGLDLWRDYFPKSALPATPPQTDPPPIAGTPPTAPAAATPPHEFQTVTLAQAYAYWQTADSSVLFVDARSDDAYSVCRIPSAVQFFYYYPARYLADLMAQAPEADVIIIYCNGGDCEDSLQTARYLANDLAEPIDYERLYVFEGGVQEWLKAGYPLEPEHCTP